jgi:hypothetical protein
MFGRRKPRDPIVVDMTTMRLALELAIQEAAREELRRQLEPYFPGRTVHLNDWEIQIGQFYSPPIDIGNRWIIFGEEPQ